MIPQALLCICLFLFHSPTSPELQTGPVQLPGQDLVDVETVDGSLRVEIPTIGIETSEIRLLDKVIPIRDILSIGYSNHETEAQPLDLLVLRNQSRWRGRLLLNDKT